MIFPQLSGIRDHVWSHKHFSRALDLAATYASLSPPGGMVLVVGTSGSGKTTLARKLIQRLVGDGTTWSEGSVPVCATSICNDVGGLFNSKNLVLRLLQRIDHPFYGLNVVDASDTCGSLEVGRVRLRYSEPHLRLVLERAMDLRSTKFVVIDEAQHLLKTASVRQAVNHLDSIKSLAERTGAVIVLVGTYEVLPIWNRSAQLNRRLQDVILDRYKIEIRDDLLEFERILESYARILPLANSSLLHEMNEFLYEKTFGIIGELARLLAGAHALMIVNKEKAIDSTMLKQSAHSATKLKTMVREALGGEELLVGGDDEGASPITLVSPPKRKKKGRVGRIPKRDPVVIRTSSNDVPKN